MEDLPGARALGIISKPMSVKVGQVAGLTLSAFLVGQSAPLTYAVLPTLMQSPAPLLARQFAQTTRRTMSSTVPGSLVASALFCWMASREPSYATHSFRLYAAAAAVLGPVAALYDGLLVRPTSSEVCARDEQCASSSSSPTASAQDTSSSTVFVGSSASDTDVESQKSDATGSSFPEFVKASWADEALKLHEMTVHQLVDRWGWLNLGGAALRFAGTLCAMWAVVGEDLSFFELF